MDKKFPPWKLTRVHRSVFLSHIWSKTQLDMVWISETDFTNSTVFLKKPLTPSPFVWTIGIKFIKHCWVGGGGPPLGGICPVFPESLFFNSKARFGVQDENLKKSRLQDSFRVNFKSVLCQSYVNFMPKKPAFFLHGFDPAPSPFDIVKKMQVLRNIWCRSSKS